MAWCGVVWCADARFVGQCSSFGIKRLMTIAVTVFLGLLHFSSRVQTRSLSFSFILLHSVYTQPLQTPPLLLLEVSEDNSSVDWSQNRSFAGIQPQEPVLNHRPLHTTSDKVESTLRASRSWEWLHAKPLPVPARGGGATGAVLPQWWAD